MKEDRGINSLIIVFLGILVMILSLYFIKYVFKDFSVKGVFFLKKGINTFEKYYIFYFLYENYKSMRIIKGFEKFCKKKKKV